jgi:hypothetical protein
MTTKTNKWNQVGIDHQKREYHHLCYVTNKLHAETPQQASNSSKHRVQILQSSTQASIFPLLKPTRIAINLRTHFGQLPKLPFRQRDARLLIDRSHERRQHLIRIPDRGRGIIILAARGARVPDRQLGLHALHGGGVGFGEVDVQAFLDHEVLDQALGSAEGVGHLVVGVGHFGEAFSFFCGADEAGFGFFAFADE